MNLLGNKVAMAVTSTFPSLRSVPGNDYFI